MTKKFLFLLIFLIPLIVFGQTKKGIRTTFVDTDTLYINKTDSLPTSSTMLVLDPVSKKVYTRYYAPGAGENDTVCIYSTDTIYFGCDTAHLDSVTYYYADPSSDGGYLAVWYPARDSLYNCETQVSFDTNCTVYVYAYSPWIRDVANEAVILKYPTDNVGIDMAIIQSIRIDITITT